MVVRETPLVGKEERLGGVGGGLVDLSAEIPC